VYADLLKDVVDFHGDLVRNIKDIRASQHLFDDLSDDPQGQALAVAAESSDRKERRQKRLLDRRDYRYTQALGRYLWEQNQNGLLVHSARCCGTNAVISTPSFFSRVRELCFLTYRVNPTRDLVRVERTPGRRWLEIRPSSLR
jgi:hypothetical protein